MSSYSYMILPCVAPSTVFASCSTTMPANFDSAKGFVLGTWILYIACAGQREAAPLGYSPLPPNLVQADFDAVSRLPGHPAIPPLDYQHCPNPTLYHPGSGSTGPTVRPSPTPTSTPGSGTQTPSPTPGGGTTGGGGATLPPGATQVTILDPTSRAQLMAAALATAAEARGLPYTPLWIAIAALLLAVFTPMLLVMLLRPRRRKRDV
jgi:hypothetical protein